MVKNVSRVDSKRSPGREHKRECQTRYLKGRLKGKYENNFGKYER